MMIFLLSDLDSLQAAHAQFELTENVDDLAIDELEAVCERVLAEDPFEPLAFRLIPILDYARELRALDNH